jgi:hypothetical protein
LPLLLIDGWLKLKKFLSATAGGLKELLTTVTHVPVALLIAVEHALTAAAGGGAVVLSLPQAASSMTPLDAIARRRARLAGDRPTSVLAFVSVQLRAIFMSKFRTKPCNPS